MTTIARRARDAASEGAEEERGGCIRAKWRFCRPSLLAMRRGRTSTALANGAEDEGELP